MGVCSSRGLPERPRRHIGSTLSPEKPAVSTRNEKLNTAEQTTISGKLKKLEEQVSNQNPFFSSSLMRKDRSEVNPEKYERLDLEIEKRHIGESLKFCSMYFNATIPTNLMRNSVTQTSPFHYELSKTQYDINSEKVRQEEKSALKGPREHLSQEKLERRTKLTNERAELMKFGGKSILDSFIDKGGPGTRSIFDQVDPENYSESTQNRRDGTRVVSEFLVPDRGGTTFKNSGPSHTRITRNYYEETHQDNRERSQNNLFYPQKEQFSSHWNNNEGQSKFYEDHSHSGSHRNQTNHHERSRTRQEYTPGTQFGQSIEVISPISKPTNMPPERSNKLKHMIDNAIRRNEPHHQVEPDYDAEGYQMSPHINSQRHAVLIEDQMEAYDRATDDEDGIQDNQYNNDFERLQKHGNVEKGQATSNRGSHLTYNYSKSGDRQGVSQSHGSKYWRVPAIESNDSDINRVLSKMMRNEGGSNNVSHRQISKRESDNNRMQSPENNQENMKNKYLTPVQPQASFYKSDTGKINQALVNKYSNKRPSPSAFTPVVSKATRLARK